MLDIELDGNLAYVGGTGGLWIMDITNDLNPVLLSTYKPSGTGRANAQIYGMTLNGHYLFCCLRTNGVEIIDITNPSSPVKVGQRYRRDATFSYEQVIAVGNYLYLAAHDHGVEVLNISNPQQPQPIGLAPTDNAFALVNHGYYLYVADGAAGLSVVDVSDPASPQRILTLETSALAQDIVLDGNHVYVAVGSRGVDVFEISNPAEPIFVANYHVDGFTNHLNIDQGLAYLANWEAVEVVDISNPFQPQLIGTQHAFQRAMAIAVRGNTFYVGDWSTLRIYRFEYFPVPDINTDPIDLKEDLGPVKLFAVNNGITFPLAIDNTGEVFRAYVGGDDVTNAPYNVIIDQNQKIRYSQTGYNESEMKSLIEELL